MSGKRLRAAIVGLGQVGMVFDQDPKRRASGEIWTHFSAYEALDDIYDLVAAVDPDEVKCAAARERRPGLRTYSGIKAMLVENDLDVVSVCTPDATHLGVADSLVGRVRGLFMEKPLSRSDEMDGARELATRLKERGVSTRVNYYKRKEPCFVRLLEEMGDESASHACVRYSGPFDAVGSHALNLALGLSPEAKLVCAFGHDHPEGAGRSALMHSGQGIAEIVYCGPRHDLCFELEVVWSGGRAVLEENLSLLRTYGYEPSSRYAGYRELKQAESMREDANSRRFVGFLEEIAGELATGVRDRESLDQALRTQELMHEIESSLEGTPESRS